MRDKNFFFFVMVAALFCFAFIAIIITLPATISTPEIPLIKKRIVIKKPIIKIEPKTESVKIQKFVSEQDFKDYLSKSDSSGGFYGSARTKSFSQPTMESMDSTSYGLESSEMLDLGSGGSEPSRVSETNVQIAGIDEPDIVKTDGKEIYYSRPNRYYYELYTLREMSFIKNGGVKPAPVKRIGVALIEAYPPASLGLDSKILEKGDLLLDDKNNLIVFASDKIYGYDVSNPKSPNKDWTISLENSNRIITSRLYNNKIYLISRSYINHASPCPIRPFAIDGKQTKIKCSEIYHPNVPINIDSTYNISIIDPSSGKIENKISFVGSNSNSIIYMSPQAIYISYYYQEDLIKLIFDFMITAGKGIVSSDVIEKLAKLKDYDISQQAKMVELEKILKEYHDSLDDDERLKLENEFENRANDYFKKHNRGLEKTGIFKIDVDDLKILANGSIPGKLLNQFSLDEYKGNLRAATTIGGRGNFFFGSSAESVSDVYILDKNLKTIGSVKDLGKTEKIYSVRFLNDKGYVVTFRQIDPFYVIDLANPKNPQLKGELKIPGYSSYLHPISEDRILGIGKEGSKVKISMFNVSDAENPIEETKYILDEYYSEILNNHHAFLIDSKHQIFFLPGNKGSYIFSYKNDEIELIKAVSGLRPKRALYLSDYLYIIGENKITVLNENDWEKINELDLSL
ncbi:MAG: beta-propeller domain-containing protein [Patescibacteria group bacterium]|nr:beta-propeller domain-containing protein [Patescibacteria group bacterium]